MKHAFFLPFLFASSVVMANPPKCEKLLIKGSANNGESVEICVLNNGKYRYQQTDIFGEIAYEVIVDRKDTFLFYQKTEESVGKQFQLEVDNKSYFFTYITNSDGVSAQADISSVDGLISTVNINPNTVEDHIDLKIIKSYKRDYPDIKNQ